MGNGKVFINGKKVRFDSLTAREVELHSLLHAERKNTALWYSKISGQVPWMPGERESVQAKFEAMCVKIDQLIGQPEAVELTERMERE